MKKEIWFWMFFLCMINQVHAQKNTKIDSLKAILETNVPDTQKVNVYNQIIRKYKRTDTSEITRYSLLAIALAKEIKYPKGLVSTYLHQAYLAKRNARYTKANKIYQQALDAAKKYSYPKGKAQTLLGFGQVQSAQSNYDKALRYYAKALKISQQINYQTGISNVYNNMGIIASNRGNYTKALEYYLKALKIKQQLDHKKEIATMYNNIGIVHFNQGNYSQALKQHLNSLKIKTQLNDKPSMSMSYNNISLVYLEQGDPKKALEYQFKSLGIKEELGSKLRMSTNYTNIGFIYSQQKKYELALEYYFKSLKINLKRADKRDISNDYDNIGEAYLAQKKYDGALSYLNKSLSISLKLGNKSLASTVFIALGKTYTALKDYPKAIAYLNKGIALATEIGKPTSAKDGYEILTQVYQIKGNYKAAFETHVLFKQMTDSLLNNENTKKITRLAANHEFQLEKDSLQIKQVALNAQLEKEKLTSNFRRNISILVSLGLVAMIILAFFIYRSRQQQKQTNIQLTKQKKELQTQKAELQEQKKELHQQSEELMTMNEELQQSQEEITAQRDDIEQKKMLLGKQHHKLTQSVKAALTIQKAILPVAEQMLNGFDEHFVIYKPKDVVSGDFYWIGEVNNKRIVGAIDCTGHGIPGAFMSMIGFTILNDIVNTKKVSNPSIILEMLRTRVPRVLKQQESGDKNGMDAAFTVLEEVENNQIQVSFAGAKRPLWYVAANGSGLNIIKGTNVSIGFTSDESRTIINHTLLCNKGTLIYLGSDGFADQNDSKRIKFGSKNLQKLVYQNHTLPLVQQQQALENALADHMQDTEQRDDILLVGIKI